MMKLFMSFTAILRQAKLVLKNYRYSQQYHDIPLGIVEFYEWVWGLGPRV